MKKKRGAQPSRYADAAQVRRTPKQRRVDRLIEEVNEAAAMLHEAQEALAMMNNRLRTELGLPETEDPSAVCGVAEVVKRLRRFNV